MLRKGSQSSARKGFQKKTLGKAPGLFDVFFGFKKYVEHGFESVFFFKKKHFKRMKYNI